MWRWTGDRTRISCGMKLQIFYFFYFGIQEEEERYPEVFERQDAHFFYIFVWQAFLWGFSVRGGGFCCREEWAYSSVFFVLSHTRGITAWCFVGCHHGFFSHY